MRSAHRAVIGGGPGPEGNVTKLVLSEIGHETAAVGGGGQPGLGLYGRRRGDDVDAGADAPRVVDRRRDLGD